jgi:endonuclease-3
MKKPFDVVAVLTLIEPAIAPYPKAALFDLYDRGYTSVFEQLVACVISIRTFDEASLPIAMRLFEKARTPEAIMKLGHGKLAALLEGSSFPGQKAETIMRIAGQTAHKWNGVLPADATALTSIKGIGPKCAHLALGIAAKVPVIGVDIHVHRVSNRWGYVQTSTPEQTLAALEQKLPQSHWVIINKLLVPFGKHICTGKLPHCSTCPVLDYCSQAGVAKHR